jgi:hypothetical protein
MKIRHLGDTEEWGERVFSPMRMCFSPNPEPGASSAMPLPKWEQQSYVMMDRTVGVRSFVFIVVRRVSLPTTSSTNVE